MTENKRKKEEREETDIGESETARERENKHRSIFRGGLATRF